MIFTGNEIQNILLKSQSLGRKTLVDIGCGEGWILRLLKEKRYRYKLYWS